MHDPNNLDIPPGSPQGHYGRETHHRKEPRACTVMVGPARSSGWTSEDYDMKNVV